MPSSGSITGNHVADGNEFVFMNWQVASQDVAGNRSLINWQLGWDFVTYSCRGLRNGEAWINAGSYYYDHGAGDHVHAYNSGHDHRVPNLQVASGSVWIAHNADGTGSISLSATLTGFSGSVSSASGSFSLPTIARFSNPPSTPVISSLDQDSFVATFSDGSGGAPIDSRQLSYSTGTDPNAGTIIASDGSDTISGLTQGTAYNVWARTHNSAGYSDWSPMATATTWSVPGAPVVDPISGVTQVQAVVSWTAPYNGGTAITSYEVGYSTINSSSGLTIVTATSPKTITSLNPGIKYYFFVRANNAVGSGPWSASKSATMIAGARINVGGVWKSAVPYVKVSGVWRVARPWVKVLGTWKEST